MSVAKQAALDEGVLQPEAQYTLIQLRLGSKLPSLPILLPHGRRMGVYALPRFRICQRTAPSIIDAAGCRTGFFRLNALDCQSIKAS